MKTRYKHIHFENTSKLHRGHSLWLCLNNRTNEELGQVFYFTPWRKYCITFSENSAFDSSCCSDIADFLDQLDSQLMANKKSSAGQGNKVKTR